MTFISDDDLNYMKNKEIDCSTDGIKKFVEEMKLYLYKRWKKEYHIELDTITNYTIEEFNKVIKWKDGEGYDVLASTFDCASDDEKELLSTNTQQILEYMYGITY
jgi:hypothetical protein